MKLSHTVFLLCLPFCLSGQEYSYHAGMNMLLLKNNGLVWDKYYYPKLGFQLGMGIWEKPKKGNEFGIDADVHYYRTHISGITYCNTCLASGGDVDVQEIRLSIAPSVRIHITKWLDFVAGLFYEKAIETHQKGTYYVSGGHFSPSTSMPVSDNRPIFDSNNYGYVLGTFVRLKKRDLSFFGTMNYGKKDAYLVNRTVAFSTGLKKVIHFRKSKKMGR